MKEEHINLMAVLNELEERNELYIPGASCDEKRYMKFLTKKLNKKPKRKILFSANLHEECSKTLGWGTCLVIIE